MDKGAHFHCCDFQVHTPRDINWIGPNAVSDEERQKYAVRFIKACREKGLDAVAITDHHDLAFVETIREAARNEKDEQGKPIADEKRIIVFPGMELTLSVPCQALIIFDANLSKDLFSSIIAALAIMQTNPHDAKCNEVSRLDHTLESICETLDKNGIFKGRYIVLPNVSEGGASTLLRSGHAIHYQRMPCVGGYLDGSITQLGEGNKNIINGKDTNYGLKVLGLFQTSDNRRNDFRDLGKYTTWVKWAEPTAEALRQACLARESRLYQQKPVLPSATITSINVSNSAFMGPFYIEFNDQFNAIIGGRGTGKSTILEYVRWALCDEPVGVMADEELPSYQARRKKLVNQTLTNYKANVEINFRVNDVIHTVRRDAATNGLTIKIGRKGFEPCNEIDIRNLLPIQAYSQKQLSSVAVRIDELLRFVHTPIQKELDTIKARLDNMAAEMRRTYASIQQKRLVQYAIENQNKELESLSEQVSTIRESLKGLDKEEQAILTKYADYEKEEEIVIKWREDINILNSTLKDLLHSINLVLESNPQLEGLPDEDILRQMRKATFELFNNVKTIIEDQIRQVDKFEKPASPFSDMDKKWRGKKDEYQNSYIAAKKKSTSQEAILLNLTTLEERLRKLKSELIFKGKEIKDLGQPEQEFSELRKHWCLLHEQRSEILKNQCQNLTNISGSRINASLRKGALIDELSEKLEKYLKGSKVRSEKIDNICSRISASEKPIYALSDTLDELELIALYNTSGKPSKIPPTPILSADFSSAELLRIADKLNTESWLELCLTQLEDKPIFQYQRKEGEYIAFEDASAGQQATSLLWALLNEPGPPLIIDQPEDDLDNRMILDITQQIWKAKEFRQLIFTSHNANIVVNGDADLVVCCDYRVAGQQSGGQIKYEGAIDIDKVKSEITGVTEGGPQAFKLRKDKYGF